MINTQTVSPEQTSLTPLEVRLLLLASRPSLNAAQQQLAAQLVSQVEQWSTLTDTAGRKFVLPMVYQNLASLPDSVTPHEVMQEMRAPAMRATADILRRRAAFHWFHTHCVLSCGIDYTYFKGPALAARLHPKPELRFFRDIDILVRREDQKKLLKSMLLNDCKIVYQKKIISFSSDSSLDEFLSMQQVLSVVTPKGIVVEVHDEIDQQTSLFPTEIMLRDALEIEADGAKIKVLPDDAHITFICYHHTRHLWTKLHWLADLDAVCENPTFAREAALQYARRLKIESTVLASFELHDIASSGAGLDVDQHPARGLDLLRSCIEGIFDDLNFERKMRAKQRMGALSFHWQRAPLTRISYTWRKLRSYKPEYDDYIRFRGSPRKRRVATVGLKLWRVMSRNFWLILRR